MNTIYALYLAYHYPEGRVERKWKKIKNSSIAKDAPRKKIIEVRPAAPVDCAKIYRALRPTFDPAQDEMASIRGILGVIGGGLVLNAVLSGRIVGSIGFANTELEDGSQALMNMWFFIELSYQKNRTSEKLINRILEFSKENGILAMFGNLADYKADNRSAFLASAGMQLVDNSFIFDARKIPSA